MQDDKVTSKQNKIRIRQRNAGMTYRKWISVFLCVIFVCGLLAGCGNDKVQEEQNDNVSANTIPEDVVVHTDYGDLHYPDRWQEYVTIRQEQNGNTIAVTFETKSGEETYELFKVLISFRPKRLGRFTGFLEQKSCCASASGHSKGVLLLGEKYRHKNHRIPVDLLREMCYALSAGSPALAGKFSFMGRQVWTIIFLRI